MKNTFFIFFIFFNFSQQVNAQFYCDVKVTKEKIEFGGCYNGGLTINQLKVLDSSIREYPLRFKKINAFELIENLPIPNNGKKVEVYFHVKNKYFIWRVYEKIKGHDNDDIYSDFPHVKKKIIGNIFKRNTWYLFNFYNPSFRVFVYSDKNCNLKFVKEKLNTNW